MACTFQALAETSNGKPVSDEIGLEFHQKDNGSRTHRSPLRHNITACYDEFTNSIIINCDDGTLAEVYIYQNDTIIEYKQSVTLTFQLPEPHGQYKIEIVGENWMAIGFLDI